MPGLEVGVTALNEAQQNSEPGSRSAPERILLVRLSHLGDVVHALPVYHALREAAPEAELAWAVQPEFAGLVSELPGVSRVVLFDRRGGVGAWLRMRRELAEFDAQWAVDAQGNLKSAGVMLCSGAKRRTGFDRRDWREGLGAIVLNDAAPKLEGRLHAVERALALGRYVGELGDRWQPRGWLELSSEELEVGRAGWMRLMQGSGDGATVLQVAGPGDVRAWPVQKQRELIGELQQRGRQVLVVSGPAELEVGEALAREVQGSGVSHWVGQRGLRELAGVLSAAGEAGARFVGSDSGPMHLAVASGMGAVGLAGPQDPELTGPWGEGHVVVHAEPRAECVPCLKRECRLPGGEVCMSGIEVEQVLRALGCE